MGLAGVAGEGAAGVLVVVVLPSPPIQGVRMVDGAGAAGLRLHDPGMVNRAGLAGFLAQAGRITQAALFGMGAT